MLKCKTSNYPNLTVRRFSKALVLGVAISCPSHASHAQEAVDIVAYFQRVHDARGAGLARKTKPVDVRPAEAGEVIVTIIKGEGKERKVLRQTLATWWSGIAVRKREMSSSLFRLRPFLEDMKGRSAAGP